MTDDTYRDDAIALIQGAQDEALGRVLLAAVRAGASDEACLTLLPTVRQTLNDNFYDLLDAALARGETKIPVDRTARCFGPQRNKLI